MPSSTQSVRPKWPPISSSGRPIGGGLFHRCLPETERLLDQKGPGYAGHEPAATTMATKLDPEAIPSSLLADGRRFPWNRSKSKQQFTGLHGT